MYAAVAWNRNEKSTFLHILRKKCTDTETNMHTYIATRTFAVDFLAYFIGSSDNEACMSSTVHSVWPTTPLVVVCRRWCDICVIADGIDGVAAPKRR